MLESDHSVPSSAEVMNGGAIPPLSIRFHGLVLDELNTRTTLPLPLFAMNVHRKYIDIEATATAPYVRLLES
jgi:hypothetical protein